jgi:hypothetical protein
MLWNKWVDALGIAKAIIDYMNVNVWSYIGKFYGLIDEYSNITKR